jgi:hypothetical protein
MSLEVAPWVGLLGQGGFEAGESPGQIAMQEDHMDNSRDSRWKGTPRGKF